MWFFSSRGPIGVNQRLTVDGAYYSDGPWCKYPEDIQFALPFGSLQARKEEQVPE